MTCIEVDMSESRYPSNSKNGEDKTSSSVSIELLLFYASTRHGFTTGFFQHTGLHCLKITQKVSFNIASEASYVYILSGQKFIKNANV